MLNVSPELFEILSLALRYVFAFLGMLIVFRTYRCLLSDRRSRRAALRKTPGAGFVGELIVLHGSKDFPPDTYLPVPREGTLGSTRTCDLTVPCGGVRRMHLNFTWEDGTGLLLEPVRGSVLNIQAGAVRPPSDSSKTVLRHGDILTIGEAVLEFRVYNGLRGSAGIPAAYVPESEPSASVVSYPVPDAAPYSMPNVFFPPAEASLSPEAPPFNSAASPVQDPASFSAEAPKNVNASSVQDPDPSADRSRYRRPRRSERWKEDWSE